MNENFVIVKICKETTSFIVIKDKRPVFWDATQIGEIHIIGDLAKCLSLKFTEAEQITKAKGVCLSKAVGIKEDSAITEIIEARVEQIFNNIKEKLIENNLLKNVACFFITKEDDYLPNMDKVLARVMEKEVKLIDLSVIKFSIKGQNSLTKLMTDYF